MGGEKRGTTSTNILLLNYLLQAPQRAYFLLAGRKVGQRRGKRATADGEEPAGAKGKFESEQSEGKKKHLILFHVWHVSLEKHLVRRRTWDLTTRITRTYDAYVSTTIECIIQLDGCNEKSVL